jgi:hypothetical protein
MAWQRVRVLAFIDHLGAIHKYVLHPDWIVKWVFKSGHVPYCFRVNHDDVS